jgi:hypothetical protein
MNSKQEARRRDFLPIASVINPITKLPNAYPKRYNEITNFVVPSDNPKAELIAGNDGENKSIVMPINGKNDSKINIIIMLFVGDDFVLFNIIDYCYLIYRSIIITHVLYIDVNYCDLDFIRRIFGKNTD